jgi:hypothetical protein
VVREHCGRILDRGRTVMSAYQISKPVFCLRAGHGVTAAGQSARNFYSNFPQFTARYRRARDPILSATNQMVPCIAADTHWRSLRRRAARIAPARWRRERLSLGPTPRGCGSIDATSARLC